MTHADTQFFRDTIQQHSKSFSFASAMIAPDVREDVEVLYTWCRRADDAIDLTPPHAHNATLTRLHEELDRIYGGDPTDDVLIHAMQRLVHTYAIPRLYPEELLAGMAMDVQDTRYEDMDTLLLYCYRVAGTVGLMMSHILGVREAKALQNAVHLGIAMQLTNISRDVSEDWENKRLYIPHTLLARHGAATLPSALGEDLDPQYRDALAASVEELLQLADRYYASGDMGIISLRWRAALAIRAARLIYANIGTTLRKRGCDVFQGRVFVPRSKKLLLAVDALTMTLVEIPFRIVNQFSRAPLTEPLHFPVDVLLIDRENGRA